MPRGAHDEDCEERYVRLFIGINLPDHAKQQLGELQSRLKTGSRFVDSHPRWVEIHNLHLTLVFLGSTPVRRINLVSQTMDEAAKNFEPFELILSKIGLFPPNTKRPKVISADVYSPDNSIQKLFRRSSDALTSEGFELQNRPYCPHLTLARLASIKSADRLAPLVASHAGMLSVKFPVNEIVLFESRLGHAGPAYTELHKSVLSA